MNLARNGSEREKYLRSFSEKFSIDLSFEILNEATTHHSYKRISSETRDYECLETLGDSVLDLLVVEWFLNHGLNTAGSLTDARAEVVNDVILGEIGEEIGINEIIRTALTSAENQREKERKRILADVTEAIFGAVFVENGLASCRKLLKALFDTRLERVLEQMQEGTKSWGRSEKTYQNLVNEYFDKRGNSPVFILDWERGPLHSKLFGYSCQVIHNGDLMLGKGEGNTKKQARQEAARDLCNKLGLLLNNEKSVINDE